MSNKLIVNAISAILALGLSTQVYADNKSPEGNEEGKSMMNSPDIKGMEKCYGIARAGRNDCGNHGHTCSGGAKIDGDKNEWLYVPNGLCQKIVGGSTTKPDKK